MVSILCVPPSEPLPVHSAHILDYKESPETGVVFDMEPPAGTIFSRVNITFTEGEERRSMLYKGTQVLKVLPENLSGFSDRSRSSNRKCSDLHFRFHHMSLGTFWTWWGNLAR